MINPRFEKKLYLGFLNIHILYHASIEPFYGVWMIDELKHHGYNVGASHIYPLLKEMTAEGLISMEEKKENGRMRKYYSITDSGTLLLEDLKLKVRELSREII
ncbi:MAG: helix-turn-helix transcriptional regulator [Candidatus Izemoplasmatales bacterium]|jgi:DNA-binding PadR family transcriptional regulator|nr:helix-turn-helix transcriptional regulator [Candidatus Izemoplasmatales bacterium]